MCIKHCYLLFLFYSFLAAPTACRSSRSRGCCSDRARSLIRWAAKEILNHRYAHLTPQVNHPPGKRLHLLAEEYLGKSSSHISHFQLENQPSEEHLFFFFLTTPEAYGGSQARGRIRAAAAGLHHSHSNAGSKLHLQPMPQLTATLNP